MNNAIEITFHLPIDITKKEHWYIASCPVLDVYSQGDSQLQAKDNLTEALTLFLTSCLERGTLNAVLTECGFHPQASSRPITGDFVNIPVHLLQHPKSSTPCHA